MNTTIPNTIVWLHLSDLHLCEPQTGWDAHRVLKPLIEDLKHMEQTHGLLPQLLFFTGDAAFGNYGLGKGSSLAEQFVELEALLTGVRTAFSQEIPKDHTFLVPGNHDVDRGEVTESETHWIETQATTDNVTRLIKEKFKQWKSFMDRLTTYRQFLEKNGYDHLLEDPDRLIYSQIREINGIKLGIGGFNSAWNCCRDKEKGKLWLGADWQDGTIVSNLDKQQADLKIALIHHPLGWFVKQEDALIRIQMERDFDFFLHGHEHQGWVRNINNNVVQIAGAACYEGSGEDNGYNFVRLNLETGDVEIWLRRFDGHGGWIPRVIAGKTNNDGHWNIQSLSSLEKFKPRKSNPRNFSDVPTNQPETLAIDKQNKISPNSAMKPIRLFYSYAHKDERFRNELGEHLSNLQRQGLILEWHDRKIIAGKSWANEIDENLEKADVVLLLISSKFIASDYCHEVEMKRAMERHKQGLAIVVPILLKATDYKGCLFADVQGLPKDFKPIEKWQHRDDAYVDIVNGLRKLIEEMQEKQEKQKDTITVQPNIGISPSSISQADSVFLGKVRGQIKHIFSVNSSSLTVVRDELLKDQPAYIKPEEIFIPASNAIDLENAIRIWRKIIKTSLESRKDLGQGIKQCANDVLGWLVLLVIKEAELKKHSGQAHDFSNATEIIVPITTPAGTGIFVARLFEKPARLQLTGNKIHCSGWIDPGKLERGLFPDDRLRDIEREIYQQVMLDLPPSTGDWLKELKNTLRLRYEDDQEVYYFTIAKVDYSDDLSIVGQLRTDLPHLKAIIIGSDQTAGDSLLVMDESLLVPLLREFLLMLEKFA